MNLREQLKPGRYDIKQITDRNSFDCKLVNPTTYSILIEKNKKYILNPTLKTTVSQNNSTNNSVQSSGLLIGYCNNGVVANITNFGNVAIGDKISAIEFKNSKKICSTEPSLNFTLDSSFISLKFDYSISNLEAMDVSNLIEFGSFQNDLANNILVSKSICVNKNIVNLSNINNFKFILTPGIEYLLSDLSSDGTCTTDINYITPIQIEDGQFVRLDNIIRTPDWSTFKPHNCTFKEFVLPVTPINNYIKPIYNEPTKTKLIRTGGKNINYIFIIDILLFVMILLKLKLSFKKYN